MSFAKRDVGGVFACAVRTIEARHATVAGSAARCSRLRRFHWRRHLHEVARRQEAGRTAGYLDVLKALERGAKTQAAIADEGGSEYFGAIIGVGAGESAGRLPSAQHRTHQGIAELAVLVGGELALPRSIGRSVGADRPEIRPAADQMPVAQDGDAAVTPPDVIEHVDVDGKKPVLHLKRTPSSPDPGNHYSVAHGREKRFRRLNWRDGPLRRCAPDGPPSPGRGFPRFAAAARS